MTRPSLLRGGALNFAEGAVSLTSAVIVSILIAHALHPDGFGLYALVMSIVSFTYLFARLGIPGTVRRYAAELDGKAQRHLVGAVAGRGLRQSLLAAAAAAILLLALATPAAGFFHQPEMAMLLPIGAALVFVMIPLSVLRGLLGGLQEYVFLTRVALATSPIWVVACVAAIAFKAGIAGVLIATLLVELLNLGLLGRRAQATARLRWNARLDDELAARLRRFNVGLAALILLDVIVWQRSELLFLGRFQPASQVSFYAVPFALTERVTDLIPGALLGVLIPGLTFAQASADPERLATVFRGALRSLAVLTIPISVIGIVAAPWLIGLLYGPGFAPAAIVLQILLVAIVFGVLGQACRAALLGAERQAILLKTGAVAAALSVALDLVLIPRWGAYGAAIANTVVQATWAVAILVPVWRRVGGRSRVAVMEAIASS